MKEETLIDILHELIAQEMTELREIPLIKGDGRSAEKRKKELLCMRKLSKRDAYCRIIHILRGHDTQYPPCRFSPELLECWRVYHTRGELDW